TRIPIVVRRIQPTNAGVVLLVEQVVAVQRHTEVLVDLVSQARIPDRIPRLLDLPYPIGAAEVAMEVAALDVGTTAHGPLVQFTRQVVVGPPANNCRRSSTSPLISASKPWVRTLQGQDPSKRHLCRDPLSRAWAGMGDTPLKRCSS